jgi:hypothetical protein
MVDSPSTWLHHVKIFHGQDGQTGTEALTPSPDSQPDLRRDRRKRGRGEVEGEVTASGKKRKTAPGGIEDEQSN